jgi:hypothetical protein
MVCRSVARVGDRLSGTTHTTYYTVYIPDAPDRPAMYASLLTIVRCERSLASFPLRSVFSA